MVRKGFLSPKAEILQTTLLSSLPDVFKRIYFYLYTNSNLARAERLAAEMIRILFCKIYDERRLGSREQSFRADVGEAADKVSRRIRDLFEEVKASFSDVFEADERLHLDDASVAYVVRELQKYELLKTGRDVISEAFQAFWGSGLRGEKGQFFTPRNVVKMCVEMLDPQPGERIVDPACGSGGFLVECIAHLAGKTDRNGLEAVAFSNVLGIDKEIDLARICKAYMSILGNGHSNIFCMDSLDVEKWPDSMKEIIKEDSFDLVLTNPPFGAKISLEEKRVLRRYNLGHTWEKTDRWRITDAIADKQAPQVLFIERCLQLLKMGGRMAIVLPDGVFGNPSDRYVLEYIFEEAEVIAIVSLSHETFMPSTHTKTSVLFLKKKELKSHKDRDYEIFMAIANKVGHDKNGKPTYKIDKKGDPILDKQGNLMADDDLPEIASRYRQPRHDGYDHLGFTIESSETKHSILIPNYYDPEIKEKLKRIQESGKYSLTTIKELAEKRIISIKRGNEVGSRYYGMGVIPFVRTTDITNWEIRIDPIKSIPEEIYDEYRESQDIRENDILFVSDGTFLIGRTAIVTSLDKKMVIQSHIRRIRCLKPEILHPYMLLYLFNTDVVRQQISAKTFVQATISTIGNRINEIALPIPKDKNVVETTIKEVAEVIDMKTRAKLKMDEIVKHFVDV